MKRVRVAAGKHLMISPELATKVERVFATALTRQQALDLMVTEPRRTGLMAGSKKPLAIAGPRQRDRAKLPDPKQPSTPPMQQALTRSPAGSSARLTALRSLKSSRDLSASIPALGGTATKTREICSERRLRGPVGAESAAGTRR